VYNKGKANHYTEEAMRLYNHFTFENRICLQVLKKQGKSLREIAKEIGYNVSNISRELTRNSNPDGSYQPTQGTKLYIKRRKKCVKTPRIKDEQVKAFVIEKLKASWSPEIIAEKWKQVNPYKSLSKGAIYYALSKKLLEKDGISAKKHLIRHGKPHNHHNSRTIHPENTIHERPLVIEKRERLGDLEGDTVLGGVGKGCLVTLVDRKNRMLYSSLSLTKESEKITEAFRITLSGVDVKSITLDNGSEFAGFKNIESNHKTTVYFADPHSPWQRGSNENVNGLLRFFFPKGTDFRNVNNDTLKNVVNLVNNRPRKCLGWLSPIEFSQKCCT
jgi:IS30 family transposase